MSKPTFGTKFRPSNADRYINCPASVVVSQNLETDEGSVYADAGTVAHKLIENCLATGKQPEEYLGQKICTGIDIPVDPGIIEGAKLYLDWVHGQGFTDIDVEIKLNFPWIENADGSKTTGTADLVGYSQDFHELTVVDYKNGVMPVPDDSLQFAMYAIPVLDKRRGLDQIKAVRVQPNVMEGARIGEHIWTRKALAELKAKVKDIVAWVKTAKPEDVKDKHYCEGHWCKFCPARKVNKCPVKAAAFFDAVDVDTLPPPSTIDQERVKKVLAKRNEFKQWIDDVYDYYFAQAYTKGTTIDGFKIVEGRAKPRAWQKELETEEIVAKLKAVGVMDHEVYQEPKLITPATAKKILKKDFDKLDCILTPAEKSVELVPVADHRPPVGGVDYFSDEPTKSSESESGF